MATGTVKFFNDQKGYGFISRDDGDDLFVHFSNIVGTGRRTLIQGQKVNFELGEGRKGPEARGVQPLRRRATSSSVGEAGSRSRSTSAASAVRRSRVDVRRRQRHAVGDRGVGRALAASSSVRRRRRPCDRWPESTIGRSGPSSAVRRTTLRGAPPSAQRSSPSVAVRVIGAVATPSTSSARRDRRRLAPRRTAS